MREQHENAENVCYVAGEDGQLLDSTKVTLILKITK